MNSELNDIMGSRPIILRIDNLPPGKNWKQIKYLIGGIIHHTNVLKVKLLPLMTSLVPPFIPFQSCIVTLKPTLDNDSLNDLLLELNTYQWDYYNLYAYTLPPPPMRQVGPSDMESTSDVEHSSSNGNTPKVQNNSFLYPMPIPATLPNGMPAGIPAGMPAGMPTMASNAMLNPQQITANGSMPPQPMMGMPTQRRRYYQPPIQSYNQRSPFNAGGNQQRNKNNTFSAYSYYSPNSQDFSSNPDSFKPILKQNNGQGTNTGSSRGLKQIFNEKSFRKQMTGRGMWQLQIENFPPFLKLETFRILDEQDELRYTEKGLKLVETSQPDKYGRLRWTVLKDYIKLKCPKLLNLQEKLQSQLETSQDGVNPNNTREFYVGVYEDEEIQVRLDIVSQDEINGGLNSDENVQDPADNRDADSKTPFHPTNIQKGVVNAIVYKAIVGFNDKELCDTCFECLLDQEYSLGYRIKVHRLPPFEEEKSSASGDSVKED